LSNNHFLLDGWDPIDLSISQTQDLDIAKIKMALQDGKQRPALTDISAYSSYLKTLWRQWDRLEIACDLLYRRFETDDGDQIYQLVTPKDRQRDVIRHHHDTKCNGHLGIEKTLGKIRQPFYWPGMVDTVEIYCQECDKCAAATLSRTANKAPLGQYFVWEPGERLMMDILGPLPVTTNGNKYILVMADWFTKWTESVALHDIESKNSC
jgi:hypothetical protein